MKDEGSLGSLQTAPEMVCQTVVSLKINKEPGGDASFIQGEGNDNQDPETRQTGFSPWPFYIELKRKKKTKKQNDRTENKLKAAMQTRGMTLLRSAMPRTVHHHFFTHNDSIMWLYSIFEDNKTHKGNLSPSHTTLARFKDKYVQVPAPDSLYLPFQVKGSTDYSRRPSCRYG